VATLRRFARESGQYAGNQHGDALSQDRAEEQKIGAILGRLHRAYEFIEAAGSFCSLLCLGLLRPNISSCLDAPGICVLRYHYSGTLGGDLRLHVRINDWILGGWEVGRPACAQDRIVGDLFLRPGRVDYRNGRLCRSAIFCYRRELLTREWRYRFVPLSFLVGDRFGVVDPAVVPLHGRDLSIHDGVRARTRYGTIEKFQLPLSGECTWRDGRNTSFGHRAD